MPRLALALCVLWFTSLFVFRTFIQKKNTGSTGFKGFHGSVGSLAWIAGILFTAGLLLAPLAPIAAINGWIGGALYASSALLHALGVAFALSGILGALLAQHSMGDSWRVGVDENETTELVTSGLFAWVRNPIFTFVWLSLLGLVLLVPNAISLVGAAAIVVGIELQVRAVEEPYLQATHGTAYLEYASRVGRFVPNFGRLSPQRAHENASG